MEFRLEVRTQLAILARERGYNEELLAILDELLEGVMKLPDFLEKQYEDALEEYKREKKTPFITAAECIGLRRGIAEGFQQGYATGRQEGLEQGLTDGLRISLSRRLKKRFGAAAQEVIDALNTIRDVDLLNTLDEMEADDASLDAIRQQLNDYLSR